MSEARMGKDGAVCWLVLSPRDRQLEHFPKKDLRGEVENAGESLRGCKWLEGSSEERRHRCTIVRRPFKDAWVMFSPPASAQALF